MSETANEKTGPVFWAELGKDVWMVIFCHLQTAKNIAVVARVCKDFRNWSGEDYVWKTIYIREFGETGSAIDRSILRAKDHKVCLHIGTKCYQDPFWKGVYHFSLPYTQFLNRLHNNTLEAPIVKKTMCLITSNRAGASSFIATLTKMSFEKQSGDLQNLEDDNIWNDGGVRIASLVKDQCLWLQVNKRRLKELMKPLPAYDVVVVMFSIVDYTSFSELQEKLEEIQKNNKKVILVGTHLDETLHQPKGAVQYQTASEWSRKNKFLSYFEISSKTLTNLSPLLLLCARASLNKHTTLPERATPHKQEQGQAVQKQKPECLLM